MSAQSGSLLTITDPSQLVLLHEFKECSFRARRVFGRVWNASLPPCREAWLWLGGLMVDSGRDVALNRISFFLLQLALLPSWLEEQ